MAVSTGVAGLLGERLSVGVRHEPDGVVLVVGGDLDLAGVPLLEAALGDALRQALGARVVLDLGGVGFIDAAGLGCIVRAGRRLTGRGGALAVRRPSRPARRLLELCGLEELLC